MGHFRLIVCKSWNFAPVFHWYITKMFQMRQKCPRSCTRFPRKKYFTTYFPTQPHLAHPSSVRYSLQPGIYSHIWSAGLHIALRSTLRSLSNEGLGLGKGTTLSPLLGPIIWTSEFWLFVFDSAQPQIWQPCSSAPTGQWSGHLSWLGQSMGNTSSPSSWVTKKRRLFSSVNLGVGGKSSNSPSGTHSQRSHPIKSTLRRQSAGQFVISGQPPCAQNSSIVRGWLPHSHVPQPFLPIVGSNETEHQPGHGGWKFRAMNTFVYQALLNFQSSIALAC